MLCPDRDAPYERERGEAECPCALAQVCPPEYIFCFTEIGGERRVLPRAVESFSRCPVKFISGSPYKIYRVA
jgi:hypothetical protein